MGGSNDSDMFTCKNNPKQNKTKTRCSVNRNTIIILLYKTAFIWTIALIWYCNNHLIQLYCDLFRFRGYSNC